MGWHWPYQSLIFVPEIFLQNLVFSRSNRLHGGHRRTSECWPTIKDQITWTGRESWRIKHCVQSCPFPLQRTHNQYNLISSYHFDAFVCFRIAAFLANTLKAKKKSMVNSSLTRRPPPSFSKLRNRLFRQLQLKGKICGKNFSGTLFLCQLENYHHVAI